MWQAGGRPRFLCCSQTSLIWSGRTRLSPLALTAGEEEEEGAVRGVTQGRLSSGDVQGFEEEGRGVVCVHQVLKGAALFIRRTAVFPRLFLRSPTVFLVTQPTVWPIQLSPRLPAYQGFHALSLANTSLSSHLLKVRGTQ